MQSIIGALIDKNMFPEMSKVLMKELNVVAAKWDLKP